MMSLLMIMTSGSWAADLKGVDPACYDVATDLQADIAAGKADYSEQGQQDFLLNYFAMATSLSPLHAPVPHEGGHGSFNLEVMVIPPLGCSRRLVLSGTKTEDTNKAPAAPRQDQAVCRLWVCPPRSRIRDPKCHRERGSRFWFAIG